MDYIESFNATSITAENIEGGVILAHNLSGAWAHWDEPIVLHSDADFRALAATIVREYVASVDTSTRCKVNTAITLLNLGLTDAALVSMTKVDDHDRYGVFRRSYMLDCDPEYKLVSEFRELADAGAYIKDVTSNTLCNGEYQPSDYRIIVI